MGFTRVHKVRVKTDMVKIILIFFDFCVLNWYKFIINRTGSNSSQCRMNTRTHLFKASLIIPIALRKPKLA